MRTRRRTGVREEDGADTELKTKTPHVNVGNDGVPARFWMCVATATCRTRSLQKRSANTRVFIDLRHQEFSASFATRIIVTHHTETFAHICSSFRPNITRNLPKFSLFRRVFFSAQLAILLCCNLQFWCPNWSYFLPVFLGCPRLPMTRLHLGGAKFSQVSELLRRCCVHVCYEARYSVIAVFACIRGASGCKA